MSIKENKRSQKLFFESKYIEKLCICSVVRNFIPKGNKLPIKVRKETSETKFKQNDLAQMLNDTIEF